MTRVAFVLFAAVVLLAGCHWSGVKGNGVIKTENRPIADFSSIKVAGGYQIKWSAGKPSLTITADENLLPLIRATASAGRLKIGSEEALRPTRDITIVLSSASLSEARLSGGNSLNAGPISGPWLKLKSTGASDITVDGSVTDLKVTMTGAGKLNAKSLQAKNATLSLTGAAEADVAVTEMLKVSVTGAATLTYSGNPKTVEQKVTGAGSIRRRE